MIRCFTCGAAISGGHEVIVADRPHHEACAPSYPCAEIGLPQIEQIQERQTALESALEIVLRLHRGGEWTKEDMDFWEAVTGSRWVTSKVMCDHIREVLKS